MKSKISNILWILPFIILFAVLFLIHYPIKEEEIEYQNIDVNWDDDRDVYEIFIDGKRFVDINADKVVVRYDGTSDEYRYIQMVLMEKTKYTILTEYKDFYLCVLFM